MTDSHDRPANAPSFDLARSFRARQQQLEAELGLARAVATHPGTRGEAAELDWRGMLGHFLPKRYGVTKAFVVDVDGGRSEQLDVVIHDRQYSPLLFELGGAHFIPAESVYAVFEVKQAINKGHVEYAGDKIASVRGLRRTSVGFPTANGPAVARTPPRVLGGLLALNSDWTPMLAAPLRQALEARTADQRVDLALALRAGAFEVPDPTRPNELTACDDPATALIFFLLRLLKRLQGMATVGAMDLDAYTRAVWSTQQ